MAEAIGFEYDKSWSTQQFDSKLMKALAGVAWLIN